ncbi:MAG: glycosyltransferase family 4 protein [Candidatus Omnitrophica bacterium]|nr:glycosyltransferase family 4 protein [Candidatus Omnitrophota bacterium]
MDILFLNWKDLKNPEVGGAEIILFEFARRLIKEGHAVTVFTRNFQGGKSEETIDGVKVIRRGNMLTTYLHAFFYYCSLKQKPDLVVDMLNTLAWQSPLYARKSKCVLYVNQLAREVLFYELPFPLGNLAYLFEPLQFLPYKKSFATCYAESTKKDLVALGIPDEKINIFPLGLDHSRYVPGKKSSTPLFITVSRLVKMKRVDLSIRAMSIITSKCPEAKLAIIGYGKEEKNLRQLVKKLYLEKNVFFVGKDQALFFKKTSDDVKVDLMQQAWALLFPSVKEGWGMVVTEANACGTPAIVSNVTGLKDSVVNEKTGIILSKNPTEQEMASAISKIINDNAFRAYLFKNASDWSRKFDWDESFKQFKTAVGIL